MVSVTKAWNWWFLQWKNSNTCTTLLHPRWLLLCTKCLTSEREREREREKERGAQFGRASKKWVPQKSITAWREGGRKFSAFCVKRFSITPAIMEWSPQTHFNPNYHIWGSNESVSCLTIIWKKRLAVACFTFLPSSTYRKKSYPIVIPGLFCLAFSRDSGGQTRALYHKTSGPRLTFATKQMFMLFMSFEGHITFMFSIIWLVHLIFSLPFELRWARWDCETGAGSANRAIRHQSPPRWQVFHTTFVRVRWAQNHAFSALWQF